MKETLLVLTSILILGGCATPGGLVKTVPTPTNTLMVSSHELKSSADLQYLSCDTKSWFVKNNGKTYGAPTEYKRDWASSMHALPSNYKTVASKSVPYSIMVNNVYRDPVDKPIFSLPGWIVADRLESDSGLALEELHRVVDGNIVEVAVVYKGTDAPSWRDWKTNLSIWLQPTQYEEAHRHIKELLDSSELKGVPITVAGHSLGGGIALNISLRHSTEEHPIRTFTFNTSPRGFYEPINESIKVERYLLDEKGEFLGGARPFWHYKLSKYDPLTYNFLDFTALYSKPVSEHSIYLFSRALLLVALGNNDSYARDIFRANFNMEKVEAHIPSSQRLAFDKERDIKLCQDILTYTNVAKTE